MKIFENSRDFKANFLFKSASEKFLEPNVLKLPKDNWPIEGSLRVKECIGPEFSARDGRAGRIFGPSRPGPDECSDRDGLGPNGRNLKHCTRPEEIFRQSRLGLAPNAQHNDIFKYCMECKILLNESELLRLRDHG